MLGNYLFPHPQIYVQLQVKKVFTEGAIQDMDDNSNSECPIIDDTLTTDSADKVTGAEMLQVNTSATPIKTRLAKRKAKDPLGDEWLRPSKRALFCICQTPNDPKKAMIACDLCGSWYHMGCLGLSPRTT